MEQSKHIGKLINRHTNEILGNIFCVMWQSQKVYITSSVIMPIANGFKQKITSLFKSSVELEDINGNRAKLKHIKSKNYITTSVFYMGKNATYSYISIFELDNDSHLDLMPLTLAKGGFYKTLKAELLTDNQEYARQKCKILCNSEIGFIQNSLDENVVGSPIVSYGSGSVLGFYCDKNHNNEQKTLKAGSIKNIRAKVDFNYIGKVTTVETIKRCLTEIYGGANDRSIGWYE